MELQKFSQSLPILGCYKQLISYSMPLFPPCCTFFHVLTHKPTNPWWLVMPTEPSPPIFKTMHWCLCIIGKLPIRAHARKLPVSPCAQKLCLLASLMMLIEDTTTWEASNKSCLIPLENGTKTNIRILLQLQSPPSKRRSFTVEFGCGRTQIMLMCGCQ